jgi:hypothetical protein
VSPDRSRDVEFQREVTRIALAGIEQAGFALAGSGAIREHGVIDRPTEDVDLFTTSQDVDEFGAAVGHVAADLRGSGYEVLRTRQAPQFARLHVRSADGFELDVDLGVDWRENDPVQLDVGPVLSLTDAVGNKVSALYSRAEARDYLDVDAIRASGRFTDEELMSAAAERDPGFDVSMFAQQLDAARRLQPAQVARYGVDADQLDGVKERCTQWAARLHGHADTSPTSALGASQGSPLAASYPQQATRAVRGTSDEPPATTPPRRARMGLDRGEGR